MPKERTLALIKSGAIQRGNASAIMDMVQDNGLRIVRCAYSSGEPIFHALYREHAGRPYYEGLINSVSGGSQAMILEGENAVAAWRALMGPTDPMKAQKGAPGTLRALFGREMPDNAVHGSGSLESAAREIALLFPTELIARERAIA